MDLSTSFMGMKFKNPLMPASGPLVGDDEKIIFLNKMGLGAMVTKTISINGAMVPRPCIIAGENNILNVELWSEYSLECWVNKYLPNIKKEVKSPLIISTGYTKEDMKILIPALDPFADAFEISTHYVGKDLSIIAETIKTIRSLTNKPVFMKLSPHMPDPVAFSKMVLESGGDGVVAINSVGPTMSIDLKKRSIVMGNTKGEAWMSGPVIKPIALAMIAKIKREVPECKIIGVGGISSAKDVLEFLLAGANLVQMLSAAMLKGIDLYKKIIDELPQTLKNYGFSSIQEVIDTPLNIPDTVYEPIYPNVDEKACILCQKCIKSCPYFAMSKVDNKIIINKEYCFGCTLCKSICPKNAISF
ncbi:4Fe-4S dicluster-binding protein [Defluviitalea phaphyphila]|uniref:4Fe-4S dicluster-binding protein n=1 Tax=Defluviitalea phaphyphila TaxID=1473580 RepID=UPI000731053E|nr:4Fe-4S dicluster-binding protein [Defluviitalea phaphyphila]